MNGALLTAEQVGKLLGVPTSWVYEQSRQGRIPTVTLGRYRRYRAEAIDEWLEELERNGGSVAIDATKWSGADSLATCAIVERRLRVPPRCPGKSPHGRAETDLRHRPAVQEARRLLRTLANLRRPEAEPARRGGQAARRSEGPDARSGGAPLRAHAGGRRAPASACGGGEGITVTEACESLSPEAVARGGAQVLPGGLRSMQEVQIDPRIGERPVRW